MTYATQDDMVKRFGETELAQRTNRVDGSSIDAVVLTRAGVRGRAPW
jgi:phage gp36-like protein